MGSKARAAGGTAVFLVVVPGTVAGLVPWLLTGWEVQMSGPGWLALRLVGAALVAVGTAVLLHAFVRFALDGLGTPAPVAPTEHLVVTGLYRYVRNPMYLAVAATILGQALLLGQPVLVPYALVFGAAVTAFARWYEEPALERRFGPAYAAYRDAVPAWWPRRSPWDGT
jgi:protein-S-isoprenylcysteine O-methyltransferase Ste14